jgi:hypothetical protein
MLMAGVLKPQLVDPGILASRHRDGRKECGSQTLRAKDDIGLRLHSAIHHRALTAGTSCHQGAAAFRSPGAT